MDKIERMYEYCRVNDIQVDMASLDPSTLGVYVQTGYNTCIIGLNKAILKNRYVHMDVLGEELGHYNTTCGNFVGVLERSCDRISLNKMERKASKWSCNYLIDDDDLINAIKCCCSTWEMAEYLDVPEHILKFKLDEIKSKDGLLKIDGNVYDLSLNGCFYNGYDGC
ncbi:MAG: hypothetical protein ACRCXT_02160 [Paraclostridium sp.]